MYRFDLCEQQQSDYVRAISGLRTGRSRIFAIIC